MPLYSLLLPAVLTAGFGARAHLSRPTSPLSAIASTRDDSVARAQEVQTAAKAVSDSVAAATTGASSPARLKKVQAAVLALGVKYSTAADTAVRGPAAALLKYYQQHNAPGMQAYRTALLTSPSPVLRAVGLNRSRTADVEPALQATPSGGMSPNGMPMPQPQN